MSGPAHVTAPALTTTPGVAAVLAARGLAVGYRSGRRRASVVLEGLDLRLEPGELTCLLGPNGSGKTTLLRTLTGLQEPLGGGVRLLGDDVRRLPTLERARRLAVVLTDQVDAGLLRAADLVALGRHPHTGWAGRLEERDREVVRWALRATGAGALAERRVVELSDGERQRVLIARALAQEPAVLALDEPVAFVDVPRRLELMQLLRHLARDCGLAVLVTTHDLDLAIRTSDRLWLLEPQPAATPAVHVAAPEDCVLSGAVARAFCSDEVAFDMERGVFQPRPAPLGRVRVVGEGPAATWAARALEREGLLPVPSPHGANGGGPAALPVTVEVTGDPAAPRWRLRGPAGAAGSRTVEHTSIGALLADLRRHLPDLVAAPPPGAPAGPAPHRAPGSAGEPVRLPR